jgi:5'-nucleotidase
MKRVLLVNDDGYTSPGLRALLPALSNDFELTVVAPAAQKSWIGKASSYHREIRSEKITVDSFPVHVLEGTPSDCVSAGIHYICEKKPDMVVSGINVGANVGDSYILSSGTVGGAIEAALAGIPAIAVGVEFLHEQTRKIEFEPGDEDVSLFLFAASLTRALAIGLFSTFFPSFSSSFSSSVPLKTAFTTADPQKR